MMERRGCKFVQWNMLLLANVGVPMLFVVGPVFVVGLLPIVLVESIVLRLVTRLAWRRAVVVSLGANALSTLVGVPLTWGTLVLVQMFTGGGTASGAGWESVTRQAAWLMPYKDELGWMIPVAAMVLNVPFFFASVWIERWAVRRACPEVYDAPITKGVWRANLASYVLLTAFWLVQLLV